MMARPLTARQQQIYDFIQHKLSTNGISPTVREIGDFVGIKSPNGVMCHLRALERKGMIVRTSNKSRAIEIATEANSEANGDVGSESSPLPVPPLPDPFDDSLAVRGYVAGDDCKLFEAPLPYDVFAVLHRTGRYLLQYNGSELRDYSIADGDMLVIEPARQGDGKALELLQACDGSIQLKSPLKSCARADIQAVHTGVDPADTAVDSVIGAVIGTVVGVLRIHRQSAAIKPYHLHERQVQRA